LRSPYLLGERLLHKNQFTFEPSNDLCIPDRSACDPGSVFPIGMGYTPDRHAERITLKFGGFIHALLFRLLTLPSWFLAFQCGYYSSDTESHPGLHSPAVDY